MLKVNLGCGTNRLAGWENHDADVDIAAPLPWRDGALDRVFAEHVVEHVSYFNALAFFHECHRVLCDGGIVRIAVPSVERVMNEATPDYMKFIRRWVKPQDCEDDRRAAIANIMFHHGHLAPWTEGLLLTSLYFSGFDTIKACAPGHSVHQELRNVEGHGTVIGYEFNLIETVVVEATKEK